MSDWEHMHQIILRQAREIERLKCRVQHLEGLIAIPQEQLKRHITWNTEHSRIEPNEDLGI